MYNSKEFKESINNSITDIIRVCLTDKIDFSVIVSTKHWDKPLPESLSKEVFFHLDISRQTMEDSYFDLDKQLPVIVTKFGEHNENSILLYPTLVQSVVSIDKTRFILSKPFDDDIILQPKKLLIDDAVFEKDEVTDGVKQSMNAFLKNKVDNRGYF